jgi:2-methylcitrate dehydratase PrpD
MDYQDQLSLFSINFKLNNLQQEVLNRAKLIFLDSLTAIIEGNQSPHIVKLQKNISYNSNDNSQRNTGIYGTQLKNNPYLASLVNGIAMVSEEKDEGNPIAKGHPSCHFLPSLLAYAEGNNVSGSKLLESFIVGYEIGVRTGSAINLRNEIHPHGNWGLIGSGYAIGKILDFSNEEYKRIFSLGSSLPNVSLWHSVLEGHRIRDVYIGLNNLHTLFLPSLVKAGFTSSPTSIEEIYGKGLLGNKFIPEKMTEELGTNFYLMKTYFKFYPYCRFCHSPIDGILEVVEKEKLTSDMIEKINVYTYSLAARLSEQHVNNDFAGKFSIPFAIAGMISNQSSPDEISQLAEKVFVYEDQELTKLLPYERNTRIEVQTKSNNAYTVYVKGATGDSNEENLEEKVKLKCRITLESILGPSQAESLVEQIMNLESIDNLQQMFELTKPEQGIYSSFQT